MRSLLISSLFSLLIVYVGGDFQSAGCSDEGCGIPCYLRPAEDECHYKPQDPCSAGDADDLITELGRLNSSIVRLQEKLVQKGVIPAGESCRPFSADTISNGGVIYSDLLLSVGVTAHFVCNDGFSLHGHGSYECSSDGVWVGEDSEQITQHPTCENSLVICEALVPIPNGHVSYHIVDATKILPGDVASYSCDVLYTISGTEHRICLRNGTWSGIEPECIAPTTTTTEPGRQKVKGINVAVPVGVVFAVVGVIVVLVIIVAVIYCKKRKVKGSGYEELLSEQHGKTAEKKLETKLDDEENLTSHQLGVATLQAAQ